MHTLITVALVAVLVTAIVLLNVVSRKHRLTESEERELDAEMQRWQP